MSENDKNAFDASLGPMVMTDYVLEMARELVAATPGSTKLTKIKATAYNPPIENAYSLKYNYDATATVNNFMAEMTKVMKPLSKEQMAEEINKLYKLDKAACSEVHEQLAEGEKVPQLSKLKWPDEKDDNNPPPEPTAA